LVPNSYFELCLNVLHQINGQIGGYIRGQILATSVVAALAVSALYIIGLKYAFPIGLLAGIANMIPFLGPLIGIIAASIVALATGGEFAMALVGKVIIIFLVIQLIDNIAIQPTVVAKSVEMHPLMILFVVMVGSQLMGIVGMLVAVPLTGIIKVSAQTIYAGIRGYKLQ
jgi:predicted PurR-regulated permease PerM